MDLKHWPMRGAHRKQCHDDGEIRLRLERELRKSDIEMDTGLIWACMLHLYPECRQEVPGKEKIWRTLLARIGTMEP